MKITIGRVVVLVEDYDKAFDFYKTNFFGKKLFDSETPDGQRFLHIGFSDDDSIGIWFLKADSISQKNIVGKQTAGQPTFVFYTDDIDFLYNHLQDNKVAIIEKMACTVESKYFHCLDLYGNRITVVQLIK